MRRNTTFSPKTSTENVVHVDFGHEQEARNQVVLPGLYIMITKLLSVYKHHSTFPEPFEEQKSKLEKEMERACDGYAITCAGRACLDLFDENEMGYVRLLEMAYLADDDPLYLNLGTAILKNTPWMPNHDQYIKNLESRLSNPSML